MKSDDETKIKLLDAGSEHDSCDEMTPILPELVVKRPIYQQDELNRISQYASPDISFKNSLSGRFGDFQPQGCLRKTLPVMDWLLHYKWKEDFFGDVVAGITVAIMHIPQGMAYAILGNVPPIVGIYMAFFPVLIYVLFGTSRHNSMGTFAVTCMMTGKVVLTQIETKPPDLTNSSLSLNATQPFNAQYTATEIATAVSFVVAAYQLIMYCLRLGVMSSLLSETLVSGFTTGAAVHVLTSQIKDLFGIPLVKRRGLFKVILTYVDIIYSIDRVNITAMIISSATIVLVIFNNELIKPRVSKVSSLPVPIEMIVVVVGTTISSYLNFSSVYDIQTIGYIPVGLPEPKLPPFALIPSVMMDGFVITMVSYTISMSMALIFAQKMNYEVDANQELMAQGAGNLVGSFFSCMPFCASLSRSLIQQTVGGRTQLASLISCGILLFVLLWIGPFFEPLPRCVLASIIVIALKGMLFQVKDLIKFWRLSWSDAAVWMATFLGVVILDIEYGLLIGVLLCLVNLLVLSVRPYSCRLGLLPGTELYLDVKRYKGTIDLPGIKLFHYCGGLNFASKQHFRNAIYKVTQIIPQKEIARRTKLPLSEEEIDNEKKIKVLILDFSALMHIDPAGVNALRNIINEYKKIDVSIYLTGCSGPVYETIRKCNAIENGGEDFAIFPTVNDAVNFAKYKHRVLQIWTSCQPFTENYITGLQ